MGDLFGCFCWNAGLFGDLDLLGLIHANKRYGWFLDGRSRMGIFCLGRFLMVPILQSLESRCCVDHGIELLEIPEFGKVESDGGMIAVRLILHSLAKPASAFPQTLM